MESLPYVVFLKRSTNSSELSAEETARIKKKAKIQAKLYTQENTAHHPCNEDPGTLVHFLEKSSSVMLQTSK